MSSKRGKPWKAWVCYATIENGEVSVPENGELAETPEIDLEGRLMLCSAEMYKNTKVRSDIGLALWSDR